MKILKSTNNQRNELKYSMPYAFLNLEIPLHLEKDCHELPLHEILKDFNSIHKCCDLYNRIKLKIIKSHQQKDVNRPIE